MNLNECTNRMKSSALFLLSLSVLLCQTGCAKAEPDSVQDTVKVMHPDIPEYYLNHVIEKEEAVNEAIEAAKGDDFSFVFFTDAHWGENFKHSPAIIKDIVQNTPIKDVFFGGDVITTHSADKNAMLELGYDFQKSFSFLGDRFYCLYGNHDNNSDGQLNRVEYHLTEQEVYSFLHSQMTNQNTTYDDYYNFYVDFEDSKTRLIGLDTGRYYYSQNRNNLPYTVAFAIKALSSAPKGWHVVIAGHMWCDLKTVDGKSVCYLQSFMKDVLSVFDSYNDRKAGLYTFGQVGVRYDFTEAAATIELCIGGHNHMDAILSSDRGIPIVIVTADRKPKTSINSIQGTYQEQAVTAVILNYVDSKCNLIRIGRGEDHLIDLPMTIE